MFMTSRADLLSKSTNVLIKVLLIVLFCCPEACNLEDSLEIRHQSIQGEAYLKRRYPITRHGRRGSAKQACHDLSWIRGQDEDSMHVESSNVAYCFAHTSIHSATPAAIYPLGKTSGAQVLPPLVTIW
ncbi:hypothetical protein SADUNF_Sadunf10G0092000 [Salix dunnii]|uniref:Uncharacterized protein n=1 Tax=Salix dunnii TaxID=1413687 RepID=A0A835JT07_9ROSI|nr:hypothetical protein SADUNF_Sadunf10G0092000 [Salix dunnii]